MEWWTGGFTAREPFLKAVEGGAQPWDLIREHQLAFYKRQLGDRKAVVLGASLGGAVALDFAATHPECAPRAASTTRSNTEAAPPPRAGRSSFWRRAQAWRLSS